jgi:hypothetical protein
MLIAHAALLMLVFSSPPAKKPPSVVVLDIQSGHGVSADLASALNDSLEVEVRKRAAGYRVIGASDVRSMLALEAQKSKLGCQETGCLAEIGGALGAQEVVTGSLVRLGDTFVLTLRRVDVAKALVMGDVSETVKGAKEDPLLDAVRDGAAQLFGAGPITLTPSSSHAPIAAVEEGPAAPHGHSHTLGIVLAVGAVAATAVAIYGAFQVANFQSLKGQSQTQPISISQGMASQNQAVLGTWLGFGGAIVAAGLGTGAVLAW